VAFVLDADVTIGIVCATGAICLTKAVENIPRWSGGVANLALVVVRAQNNERTT
jgi:hypothetical protein